MVDPLGPSQTSLRLLRGGSWADDISSIWHRLAEREGHEPSFRLGHLGYRVALDLSDLQTPSNNGGD